ncbi:hypothetical protein [Halorussus sp. MSC15.2]|uniref:DUF7344 domain-containing protein n=1 Tax=Halorussus sp. MSC15.2 TaxID=2283638 RepID=UPI0013CFCBE2|nr:hypothetical protein [Halorussus sp. MSC15.2]NEU58198.1 hypothetical protein [Halorussus sp. MSC15.2]
MNDEPGQIDRILKVLRNKERRKIVEYFADSDTDTASMEVLAAQLARLAVEADGTVEASTDATRTQLHHVHLPKLEEFGIVEYDSRTGDVRYHSDDRVESIVASLADP